MRFQIMYYMLLCTKPQETSFLINKYGLKRSEDSLKIWIFTETYAAFQPSVTLERYLTHLSNIYSL